jgi:hypothetical protein
MADSSPRITVKRKLGSVAIVYFSKPGSPYPAWYCRTKRPSGDFEELRLWTEDTDDAEGAVREAADRLGCLPEQILLKSD